MEQPRLKCRFFRTEAGVEPVRDWLRGLPAAERHRIGDDIRALQFGWPIGMPLVRKLQPGLWEIRVQLVGRTARVLFTVARDEAVLLHGFIKRSRKTPANELATASRRLARLKDAAK